MATEQSTAVLVRGLDADEYERLKTRAKRNGRSMSKEAMIILREELSKPAFTITTAAAHTQ